MRQETLNLLHELRAYTPLSDVLSLELGVLSRIIIKLSTLHDELRVGRHVLRLSMLTLHLLELICFVLGHAFLLQLERLVSLGKEVIFISFWHQGILVRVSAITGSFHSIDEFFPRRQPLLGHSLILWQAHTSPELLVAGT